MIMVPNDAGPTGPEQPQPRDGGQCAEDMYMRAQLHLRIWCKKRVGTPFYQAAADFAQVPQVSHQGSFPWTKVPGHLQGTFPDMHAHNPSGGGPPLGILFHEPFYSLPLSCH